MARPLAPFVNLRFLDCILDMTSTVKIAPVAAMAAMAACIRNICPICINGIIRRCRLTVDGYHLLSVQNVSSIVG